MKRSVDNIQISQLNVFVLSGNTFAVICFLGVR